MPAHLIKIDDIVTAARERGFAVRPYLTAKGEGAYISAPGREVGGVWSNGCQYTSCDFVIDCDPDNYAYNSWFYGPFHPEHTRRDSYGVSELLAHPAMAGVALPVREG